MQPPERLGDPALVAMAFVYAICWRIGESAVRSGAQGHPRGPSGHAGAGQERVRLQGRASSASPSGLAGLRRRLLLAAWLRLATPAVFGFSFSLTIFAIVIFGGMANLTGSVLGAAVVDAARAVLQPDDQHSTPAKASLVQLIVYGVALVVLMMVRPQGVLPRGSRCGAASGTGGRREAGSRWTRCGSRASRRARVHQPGAMRHRRRRDADRQVGAKTCGRTRRSCSRPRGSASASAASSPPTTSTSSCARARSPRSSGRTAPARPRCSTCSPGSSRPTAASVKLNGDELVGLAPDKVARRGLVRSFQDVRLFNRISLPPERDAGGAETSPARTSSR